METTAESLVAEALSIPDLTPATTAPEFDASLGPRDISLSALKPKRRTPEQDLINQFVGHLSRHVDDDLRIDTRFNSDCKSKIFADVEFKSVSSIHWVIEAKSHDSADKHNTVHKIFGELLKETGRTGRPDFRYALLIPLESVNFYSRAFQSINREKYLGFGKLIPIDTVFTSSVEGITLLTWEALYDAYAKRSILR